MGPFCLRFAVFRFRPFQKVQIFQIHRFSGYRSNVFAFDLVLLEQVVAKQPPGAQTDRHKETQTQTQTDTQAGIFSRVTVSNETDRGFSDYVLSKCVSLCDQHLGVAPVTF